MSKKVLSAITLLIALSLLLSPVLAWTYPDCTEDTKYETFGPRVDELFIKLYGSEISEWEVGIEGGEIDVTDWPLDTAHYNKYIADPKLKVLGYGAEFGLYLWDWNNNNNSKLGNPPTGDPNPVYPNPMGYDVSESGNLYDNGWWLRIALQHLVNRPAVASYVGEATATALYSMVPPSMGKYMLPGADETHPDLDYNPLKASQILNNSGYFPFGPDGWRYWDRNKNGIKEAGETLDLKIFVRSDHTGRNYAGGLMQQELQNPAIKIPATFTFGTISAARLQVMSNKDFHGYTGGWSLGVDPDHVILWHWDYYWHPGRPYNYAGCNKDAYNEAADNVQYANTQADAVYWTRVCQEVWIGSALSTAIYSAAGYKVMSKTYVGAEVGYHGEEWYGVVNWPGYGLDNGYSFMNMHTSCHQYGGVLRYGFKTMDIRQINPVYAEWLWDNNVLGLIGYDSLLARDPYTLEFIPWVASAFSVDTYSHPVYGLCTKVVFTLRNDVYFTDGSQLTIADIAFTFIEIDDILAGRGLAPPWWISNVQNILSFSVLDPLNFEVLLDVKSVYAVGWIGGNRILPKHIWKPICEGAIAPRSGLPWDPTSFAPDPNCVSHGPWLLEEYIEGSHLRFVANKPGATWNTDLDDPNAYPTNMTSPNGFFLYKPLHSYVYANDYKATIDPVYPATTKDVTITVVDHNLWLSQFDFTYTGPPNNPVGQTMLYGSCEWQVTDWIDNGDGVLSPCDLIKVAPVNPPGPPESYIWLHVQVFAPPLVHVGQALEVMKYVYVDGDLIASNAEILKPCIPEVEVFVQNLAKCKHEVKVAKNILTQWFLAPNNELNPNPHMGWLNITSPIWVTIPEDITGSYYINTQLGAPDCKVDLKDVLAAALAFGSNPGHAKWNSAADINHDYKVDLKDYFAIAGKFGKW
jgi:ABC-type transport system substrate-binding protein